MVYHDLHSKHDVIAIAKLSRKYSQVVDFELREVDSDLGRDNIYFEDQYLTLGTSIIAY